MKKTNFNMRIDEERLIRWRKAAKFINNDLSKVIIEATDDYLESKLSTYDKELEKEILELEIVNEQNQVKIKNKKALLNKKKL